MRFVAAAVAACVIGVASLGDASAGNFDRRHQSWLAYNSRWCLRSAAQGEDCGYATLEQCQVSRGGVGGSCDPNPRYSALPPGAQKPRKARGVYQ
jgi:hypothetical protein